MEILPTGLPEVDLTLEGGFLKKELVIIGGRTGGGKSIIGGNIFYNIAKRGYKSAYFSLEISNQMIVSRLIGAQSNISPTRIMVKDLPPDEQKKKMDAKATIAVYEEFMYFYDDVYQLDSIMKEIRQQKYEFTVVDFIQNVLWKGEEYERLSTIALSLQKLAKETNSCILALSQLSNQMNRDKKNTDLVEYKGSGAIGHAADLGFFIEAGRAGEDSLSLRLRKNRRGISGKSFSFMIKQPGGSVISL